MRIVDLQACTASIPLETPTTFATRVVAERHFTIVRLRREDGIEGLGYCYIGNKAGHLGTIAVRDLLRESVVGRDSNQVEQIWDAMFRDTLLQGRRGLVLRAMSAIDNALWDANAKAAGLPLYKYLGGFRENTVPTYASGGYYYKDKTPADLAREVAGYVDVGFRAVKIKVGRLSAEEDAKRVKAAREAIGPNVQLFLDVNNGWNDAPTAIKAVKMFEPYDPGWIEEPFPPDEFDLFAALASYSHRRDRKRPLGVQGASGQEGRGHLPARRWRLRRCDGVSEDSTPGHGARRDSRSPLPARTARAPGSQHAQRDLAGILHRREHYQHRAHPVHQARGKGRPGRHTRPPGLRHRTGREGAGEVLGGRLGVGMRIPSPLGEG